MNCCEMFDDVLRDGLTDTLISILALSSTFNNGNCSPIPQQARTTGHSEAGTHTAMLDNPLTIVCSVVENTIVKEKCKSQAPMHDSPMLISLPGITNSPTHSIAWQSLYHHNSQNMHVPFQTGNAVYLHCPMSPCQDMRLT